MDLDANLVKEKIEEYRKDKNCAQATLMGICDVAGLDIKDLPTLAAGFGGGIGGTFDEGTCGAVTGAVMALGFIADGKQGPCAKALFNAFKEEYGSVTCGVISKNGEDKSPCVEVCVFAGEKVAELLKE
ncbi:MAG: C-GCAxxG-C-C family protein [Methanobacteriaceae archaeon]|nr:C-GCAxxG-C-C family protein [Methanobacteriaceae archaeon]